jgi:hypothetical protein
MRAGVRTSPPLLELAIFGILCLNQSLGCSFSVGNTFEVSFMAPFCPLQVSSLFLLFIDLKFKFLYISFGEFVWLRRVLTTHLVAYEGH